MPELIQLRHKAQLTLPLSVRKQLHIAEGDYLEVQVQEGAIILKVKRLIDKEQEWFWTRRWQEGEREAEADIQHGRTKKFDDAVSAIEQLKKKNKKSVGNTAKSGSGK